VGSGTDVSWQVTSGAQDPGTVERLLSLLPGWFGIPAANADYIRSAQVLPTYLAWSAEAGPAATQPVGVLLARRHFRAEAEIHLLAVEPSQHRRGVGRALVEAFVADLVSDGCALLQVKTLGPSHPDEGYAQTRQFYLALGFRPLEELSEFWGPQNPCLIMVRVLDQPAPLAGNDGTEFERATSE